MRGSLLLEVVLWGLTIPIYCIPGLIYSLWRWTTKTKACAKCSGKMLDVQSPRGEQLARQFALRTY